MGRPPRETPSRRRRARVASAASRRYVRVKRKNTTVFLNVEKSDSFGGIKAKLAEILGADAEKIHLFTSRDESTETVDTAFVDNFCESDVVVYMKMDGDKGIEVDADLLEMVDDEEYDRDDNISESERKGFTLRRDDES